MGYKLSIFRKTVAMVVIISLLGFFTISSTLKAAEIIPVQQLQEVEKLLYGEVKQQSLLKRIDDLEKTLYGKEQSGTIVERAHTITKDVLKNNDGPTLVFIVNTLEWTLANDLEQGNIVKRLKDLESIIFGSPRTGAVIDRVNKLVKMGLPSGEVPFETVALTADSLIKIRLLNKISSMSSQAGEIINFEVAEDVKVNNKLIIPEGTRGNMKVTEINKAGQMGQDGEVKLDFAPLRAIDGTKISLAIRKKAQEENRSQQLAVGASILGSIILGPVGLVTGYFVKGNEKEIPAGSEMYIQTSSKKMIYGLKLN